MLLNLLLNNPEEMGLKQRLCGISSMGNWGHQDIFKPVYFFYKKISCPQKHLQVKTN